MPLISDNKVFIIAEAGVNHNGDMCLARQLIDIAAKSGADAVKFQTFIAEELASAKAPKAAYQQVNTNNTESQQDMLKKLELSQQQNRELINYANKKNILFLSTPFDIKSADLLEELNLPLFKIPSGEITNLAFLEYIACKGKPIILSTGMSNLGEVEEAVQTIQGAGNSELYLLHCTSNYPVKTEDINLLAMNTLKDAFKLPVGYSDHSLGIDISLAAVALGAVIIEKHFTLDKNLPGPDHKASLSPDELCALVAGIEKVTLALGDGIKHHSLREEPIKNIARRSLTASKDIPINTKLIRSMLKIKRPGTGIAPKFMNQIIGMRVLHPLKKDDVLSWEHFK